MSWQRKVGAACLILCGDETVGSTVSDTVMSWAEAPGWLYSGSEPPALGCCCCCCCFGSGTGGRGPFLAADALLAKGTGEATAAAVDAARDPLMSLNLDTR